MLMTTLQGIIDMQHLLIWKEITAEGIDVRLYVIGEDEMELLMMIKQSSGLTINEDLLKYDHPIFRLHEALKNRSSSSVELSGPFKSVMMAGINTSFIRHNCFIYPSVC